MFMPQIFLMCLKIMLLILKMLKDHKYQSHSGLELKGQVAQRSSGCLGSRCLTLELQGMVCASVHCGLFFNKCI